VPRSFRHGSSSLLTLAANDTRRRAIEIATLTLVAALGGLLFLSRESFVLDEAFSVELAGSGWQTLWEKLTYSEINGSPYYLLLQSWLGLGDGEFAVRSLSVILAAAAIPPFYGTAARLFDARAARIGSLLLVTNSFFVYYQQDARSYSLAVLSVVLATYAWTRWVERPSASWTVAYAAAAALAIYAHLFSIFVIAAHAATLVARRSELPSLRRLLGVGALLGLLLVPLMVFFATGATGQLWWVSEPTLHDFAHAFARLSGAADSPAFPVSAWMLLFGYVGVSFLALRTAWRGSHTDRLRAEWWPYVLVLCWLLFPTVGSFLLSFWKPMFIERYLIVALPALAMLAGAGLATIGARPIRFAAVAALVALSIAHLGAQYRDETKEDWRAAVAHLSAHAKAGDAVVIYRPYVRVPFEHYLESSPTLAARTDPIYPAFPWGGVNLAVDQNQPPDFAELERAEDSYDRIWLVLAHNRINGEGARTTQRLSRVFGRGRGSTTRTFPGLSVTLYRAPESPHASYEAETGARPSG
jgi:mannosyltransferase